MNIVFKGTRSAILNDIECWLLDRKWSKQEIEEAKENFARSLMNNPYNESLVKAVAEVTFHVPGNLLKTEIEFETLYIWIDFGGL